MEGSALYVGQVAHARGRPRRHRLRYPIFMLLLDLDDLEALNRRLRLFSLERFNLLSLRRKDLGGELPAREAVLAKLEAAGMPMPDAKVSLLCMPRILGHGFNPLSVYFCRSGEGRLEAIVYAVRNTFGQRHDYVLRAREGRDGWVRQGAAKAFHVSPFMPMDLHYAFETTPPGEAVHVGVDVHDDEGLLMSTSFVGARQELTDKTLLRAVLTHPWQVVGVLAAIHWEAVKIVLKGLRLYPDPTRATGKEKAALDEPAPRSVHLGEEIA